MSLAAYRLKAPLLKVGAPFEAYLMAALQVADTENTVRLQLAFPEVAAELQARYDAPGGILPGEPGWEEVQQARGRLELHTSAEPREEDTPGDGGGAGH